MLLRDFIKFDLTEKEMSEYLLDYRAEPTQKNKDHILTNVLCFKLLAYIENFAKEHNFLQPYLSNDMYGTLYLPAITEDPCEDDIGFERLSLSELRLNPWSSITNIKILPEVIEKQAKFSSPRVHGWFTLTDEVLFKSYSEFVEECDLLKLTVREAQKRLDFICGNDIPSDWFGSKPDLRTEHGILWFDLNGCSFPLSFYYDLLYVISFFTDDPIPFHNHDRRDRIRWSNSRREFFTDLAEHLYGLTEF